MIGKTRIKIEILKASIRDADKVENVFIKMK